MAMPTKDSLLIAWGGNFDEKATANPLTFSLTAPQALLFHNAFVSFSGAYEAVTEAREAGLRSKPLTTTKDTAKAALLKIGRELYGLVQDSNSVTDANKEAIGVVVRKTQPSPTPPPAFAPGIALKAVFGRTVRILLTDSQNPTRRRRPLGVSGAAVFSYVGTTPPDALSDWTFEGNTGKTTVDVQFPNSVPAGATVWVCAYWFSPRKVAGPISPRITASLPGGAVSQAA